jgi:hypothetical protein
MLAAILKNMNGPMPSRQVRLAAIFGLEPRLLVPHPNPNQAAEWERLIGAEAAPLTGNAASFVPRVDRTWGTAVTAQRVSNLPSGQRSEILMPVVVPASTEIGVFTSGAG